MFDAVSLHKWVERYNWDDGIVVMWPIVDREDIEFATALLIYWRLDGPWFPDTPSDVNAEAKRLHDFVEAQLRAGRYRKGVLRYDPIIENRLSKVQVHQLTKSGVPKELFAPEYPTAD